MSHPFFARVLALAGLCAIASVQAMEPARRASPPASIAERNPIPLAHVQKLPLDTDQRPPLADTRAHLYRSYDDAAETASRPAAGCDLGVFANSTGAALVDAVKAAQVVECLYGLYDLSGSAAGATFSEAKMVAVANAFASEAASYPGNNDTKVLQLVTFLRAGYYVQYVYPSDVGAYGASLQSAVRSALTAFFAHPNSLAANNSNGNILYEVMILIDSADEAVSQFGVLSTLLNAYDVPTWGVHGYLRSAMNRVANILYAERDNPQFRTLVKNGQLAQDIAGFIARTHADAIGRNNEYLLVNMGGELARLLAYAGEFPFDLRATVKTTLDRFTLGGYGSAIYVRMADMILYYDRPNCSYFGVCTFREELAAIVLPNTHQCSPTLRLRHQALTAEQVESVCAQVGEEEGFFHDKVGTGRVPVADDHNDVLEMVVFNSSTEYEMNSGILFGNSVNNGGIYLEGNPATPGNQARFIAYRAEWLAQFEVWNLLHEYVHYLDGRFNMYGSFGVYPQSTPYSSVWYIEGVAEYISLEFRGLVSSGALAEAANPGLYKLSDLFNNVYGQSTARIYYWGYLANRFLFEEDRRAVRDLQQRFRAGNYTPGYRNWLDLRRTAYDSTFRDWVACFKQNAGDTRSCRGDAIFADDFEDLADPPAPEPEEPADVPECNVYSNPGMLYQFATQASGAGNCKVSGLEKSNSGTVKLFIYVPWTPQYSQLRFKIHGGSGEADIYALKGSYSDISETHYDVADTSPGTEARIKIDNPTPGATYSVLIKANPQFSDLTATSYLFP